MQSASTEPRFGKRGREHDGLVAGHGLRASTEPRFGKRGRHYAHRHLLPRRQASTEPRFGKRGRWHALSYCLHHTMLQRSRASESAEGKTHNGFAPALGALQRSRASESAEGKRLAKRKNTRTTLQRSRASESAEGRRARAVMGDKRAASTEPRFGKRGRSGCAPMAARLPRLQRSRASESAEGLTRQSRSRRAPRFNGAALRKARKVPLCICFVERRKLSHLREVRV